MGHNVGLAFVLSCLFFIGCFLPGSALADSVSAPSGDISQLFGRLSAQGDAYDMGIYDQIVLLGDQAVPYLRTQLIGKTDPWLAASLLGTIGTQSARAALRLGVRMAGNRIARLHCIYLLGHLRDTQALSVLIEIMRGPYGPELGYAAEAIGAISPLTAEAAIRARLMQADAAWDPRAISARARCVRVLGNVGTSDSIPVIERLWREAEAVATTLTHSNVLRSLFDEMRSALALIRHRASVRSLSLGDERLARVRWGWSTGALAACWRNEMAGIRVG
jgi:HEAT repeat protein